MKRIIKTQESVMPPKKHALSDDERPDSDVEEFGLEDLDDDEECVEDNVDEDDDEPIEDEDDEPCWDEEEEEEDIVLDVDCMPKAKSVKKKPKREKRTFVGSPLRSEPESE